MNYTGDDNVGKRTSEEPGDSGVVGSVIAPAPPEEPVAPEAEREAGFGVEAPDPLR